MSQPWQVYKFGGTASGVLADILRFAQNLRSR